MKSNGGTAPSDEPRATLRLAGRLSLADLSPPAVEGAMRRHRLGPAYRLCALLALAHAVLVTVGLGVVWLVRSFACCSGFASGLEGPWIWSVVLWPLWWVQGLALALVHGRAVLRPWVAATAAWLFAAVPAALVVSSLRGFR